MLRIGLVNFLNAYPLFYALEKYPQQEKFFELSYQVPSVLSTQLQQGLLDVSLVSSIEYYRHQQQWDFFSDVGICSQGQVDSIRFFLHPQHPVFEHNGYNIFPLEKVYLDYASKSSSAMLNIILKQYKNIQPSFEIVHPPYLPKIKQLKKNEGLLLIGDNALKNKSYASIDVGEWYYSIFQKPFVYALWVFRRDLDHQQKRTLQTLFLEAYQTGQKEKEQMIEAAAAKFAFDLSYCQLYLNEMIHYPLETSFLDGMNFFFSKVDESH